MIISINNKIVPEKSAKIPVTSEMFLFGYAVFETIRTYNKKVFRIHDHLARLYMSADIIGFKPLHPLKKESYPASYPELILPREFFKRIASLLLRFSLKIHEKGGIPINLCPNLNFL